MTNTSDLRELFERHRVIVTVGAGGVGKTTVAAALALSAAQSGKRTLCLTIDPARRLASSLGLKSFPREQLDVPVDFLAAHGVALQAPLTVMMLDAQTTFDDLIRRFAATEEEAARILEHRFYAHLSKSLAGTQAYMAMEKVLSVMNDERYELIVLDTPPSARTLDFFDAPRRMSDILDSPATRGLVSAIGRSKKLQLGILAAGIRRAIGGLERVTGSGLIGEVADLLSAMNGLFGGFSERARKVEASLRSEEFAYVLVAAPSPKTVFDAVALARAMRERQLKVSALVMNRMAISLEDCEFDESAQQHLSAAGISTDAVAAVARLSAKEEARSRSQHRLSATLLDALGPEVRKAWVPAFAEDVHEPERLTEVASFLSGELELPENRRSGAYSSSLPLPRK